jgi:hypothetical protein
MGVSGTASGRCVVERTDFGHDAHQQIEHAIGFGDEGGEGLAPVTPASPFAVHQCTSGGIALIRIGQMEQSEMVAALIMRRGAFECGATFFLDQP